MSDAPLLDKSQAAAYLNTSESHVYKLWNRRELTAVKVGRLVRFHRDDLDNYIAQNRKRGKSA